MTLPDGFWLALAARAITFPESDPGCEILKFPGALPEKSANEERDSKPFPLAGGKTRLEGSKPIFRAEG